MKDYETLFAERPIAQLWEYSFWWDWYKDAPPKRSYKADLRAITSLVEAGSALRTVRSIIESVSFRSDSDRRRVNIRFGDTSYVNYDRNEIIISKEPILDFLKRKLSKSELVIAMTGSALHEASHLRYSTDVMKSSGPLPARVRSNFSHLIPTIGSLLEDPVCEADLVRDYPGFGFYLDERRAPILAHVRSLYSLSPFASIADYMYFATVVTLLPESVSDVREGRAVAPDQQARAIQELDWLQKWHAAYNRTNYVDQVTAFADHLLELFGPPPEDDGGQSSGQPDQCLNELEREARKAKNKEDDTSGDTTSEGDDSEEEDGASPAPTDKIDKDDKTNELFTFESEGALVAIENLSNYHIEIDHISDWQTTKLPIAVVDAPTFSKRARVDLQHVIVNRLRNLFRFPPAGDGWHLRPTASGHLADEELWRVGQRDFRVYEQRPIPKEHLASVTLLVDCSGSMSVYGRIENATMATYHLAKALVGLPNVRLRVRAHSTMETIEDLIDIPVVYRIWEHGQPLSRILHLPSLPMRDNADGFAIEVCVEELLRERRSGESLMLIVLSDGEPLFGDPTPPYDGRPAEEHVRSVVDRARANGIRVIQIAIGDMREAAQRRQYGNDYIPFRSLSDLPHQLASLISKAVR